MFMLMDHQTLLYMLVVEEEDSVLLGLQMVDLVVADLVVSALQKMEKVDLQALVAVEEVFMETLALIQILVAMVVQEQLSSAIE